MKTIVAQEKERCRLMSANFTAMTSSCSPDFDGSMCWESNAGGDIVQMECPFEFCSTCTVEVPRQFSGDLPNGDVMVKRHICVAHGCFTNHLLHVQDWICKLILAIIMYSTLASVFWMFLEGSYLVSRFTIMAMRSEEGHFVLYLLTGWGLPFVFVLGWVLALELQAVVPRCWLPYTNNKTMWLLISPMSIALGLNFLFLLIILVLLVQKLWASNTIESKKIWKTIKATVLLVPLLGTTNLLLFYEPNPSNERAHQAYMLLSAILQHSQGIFVALFYCFGNGEVQLALKRQAERLRHYQPLFVNKRSHGSQTTKFQRRYSQETMDSKI
ncbi:hypothetical protein M514_22939 [Trichuris suis]|uniref:G-protein coupled receptors family 2 profile 2 domain-containing protein n=1 Tax=Trichuris suis TaxID=68888 RepID=A0A085N615_9BILA|nr:hypothetical protein M514_22939 [Trichuris suis]